MIFEVIKAMMGEYARQTDFTTFLQNRGDDVRNDLARLQGARFVSAVEVEGSKRFAEVLVKQFPMAV